MSRLKDLREARGLSQRDLAKLVDLPQSSIARYETGAYSILSGRGPADRRYAGVYTGPTDRPGPGLTKRRTLCRSLRR